MAFCVWRWRPISPNLNWVLSAAGSLRDGQRKTCGSATKLTGPVARQTQPVCFSAFKKLLSGTAHRGGPENRGRKRKLGRRAVLALNAKRRKLVESTRGDVETTCPIRLSLTWFPPFGLKKHPMATLSARGTTRVRCRVRNVENNVKLTKLNKTGLETHTKTCKTYKTHTF